MRVYYILIVLVTFCSVSCRDKKENTVDELSSTSKPITTLSDIDRALAVFDEPQVDLESQLLRTLEFAAILPRLELPEILKVSDKLLSCRNLNEDSLLLIIQQLTRIDMNIAKKNTLSLQGLKQEEIQFINALIEYTAHENDLEKLKPYIEANSDSLEDISYGSCIGRDLIFCFWYRYYQHHPNLKITDPEWSTKNEAAVLAKIKLAQFHDITEMTRTNENKADDLSFSQKLLLTYSPFINLEFSRKLIREEPYSSLEKNNVLANFIKSEHKTRRDHLSKLSDQEKDFLLVSNLIEGYTILNLVNIASMNDDALKRILYFSIPKNSHLNLFWEPIICSYYLAKKDPLATYRAVYDPSYENSSYVAATPLLELVKHQPELAVCEYQKLSKWPLITPIGLAFPTARNWKFSFCYHLAVTKPEFALSLGGKYLDYPKDTTGFSSGGSLTGIAYGLSVNGKEQLLIDLVTASPVSWREEAESQYSKIEDIMAGLYLYDLKLGEKYKKTLSHVMDVDYDEFGHPLCYFASRYSTPAEVMKFIDICEIPKNNTRKKVRQEYLNELQSDNPILATKLAKKYRITLESTLY